MFLFVDPDELKSSINISYDIGLNVKPSPGLEALTGADFAISRIPIPIAKATLKTHIEKRTIFVQRKSGNDLFSFDKLLSAQARMQAANIPQPQAVLLIIGNFWRDNDGMCRLDDWKAFGETNWDAFQMIQARWITRGGVVYRILHDDELGDWVNAQLKAMSGEDRDIYPHPPKPAFTQENVWEQVREIPSDDVRYFLCAGLHGFGPKLANATTEYIQEQAPHLDGYGLYFLKVLTDENEKGKAKHNIKGWGKKKRAELRSMLGLAEGYNLAVEDISSDTGKQFIKAWFGALISLRRLIEEEGMTGGAAWDCMMKEALEIFPEFKSVFKEGGLE